MSCVWCIHFYRDVGDRALRPLQGDEYLTLPGECRRYPEAREVSGDYCCGEFGLVRRFRYEHLSPLATMWLDAKNYRQEMVKKADEIKRLKKQIEKLKKKPQEPTA